MRGEYARMIFFALLAAVAYFVSARIGYATAIPQGIVTLWPPSGVMLALLASTRRRYWPALLMGAFAGSVVSDLRSGYSSGLAVAAAAANESEALFAAWLLTWRLGVPVALSSMRAVLTFAIGAAVLANALTAGLGAWMLHVGFQKPLLQGWFVWWVGDGLGMLVVAPTILTLAKWKELRRPTALTVVEGALLAVTLVFAAQIALGPSHQWPIEPGPYVIFPLLFWAAARFGQPGAALASFTVAAMALWNSTRGVGPFFEAGPVGLNAAMQTYAYLAVATLSALIAAAVLNERTVATEGLLESEQRYRVVVEGAADAIITADNNRRIAFANRAAGRVFGYTATELVGRDLATLLPSYADRRHAASDGQSVFDADVHAEQTGWRAISLIGCHRSGIEIPLEASFNWLAGKEQRLLIGILRDMTEQRAAERALGAVEDRMRFALEASGAGVWDVDFVTQGSRWSESLERLHGIPIGTFGGTFQAFLELVHPDDRNAVRDAIAEATQQHRDAELLYRSQWPDGSIHWISGIGRTSYDASGNPRSATGISLDVTERRNLEEQYRQSQKMEAIGQLAGGVAHDFNNVLTAIQGYALLVANELPSDSELQSDLAEIAHGVNRAAALTRQLLAFSRRQVMTPTVLSLADSVRRMESMLDRLIGEHIEVVVQTAPDAGHVRADAGQIEQVILNLALNARDAMPDGGVLLIEVMNVDATQAHDRKHIDAISGPCVMLAVTDTGIGMDAATISRIFEPFFTTKPQERGTGLGLSTVHGIVSQSDGRVWVYSEPGRGTTFKVYLPRVDASVAQAVAGAPADTRVFFETVLLVEDDVPLRQLAQRILESRGYSVLAAAAPREALEIVNSHPGTIHLLLTDVILPEMSGPALAERIGEHRAGMHTLYMSGYTDDAIFRLGVLERHVHFVQKPFAQEELLRKVREALEGSPG